MTSRTSLSAKIAALQAKTVAAGCTPAEAEAAACLAQSLQRRQGSSPIPTIPGLVRRPASHGLKLPWQPAEDALLRQHYPQGGLAACRRHLNRTRGAICNRARKLRLKREML